jgi:hypothetical protein
MSALCTLIANALKYGSQTTSSPRPRLPLELVYYIMRLAGCKVDSSLTRFISTDFIDSGGGTNSKVWFHTSALSSLDISRIWGLQLTTVSHGYGVNPRRWIEVAIYSPKNSGQSHNNGPLELASGTKVLPELTFPGDNVFSIKIRSDGKALKWISHLLDVDQRGSECYDGFVFGNEHELWTHLSPGDCIAVLVCCKHQQNGNRTWQMCTGEKALLKFWEYFIP